MDDAGKIAYAKIKFFGSKISNVVPIDDIREFTESLPKDKTDFSKDIYYGLLDFDDDNPNGTYVPVQICILACKLYFHIFSSNLIYVTNMNNLMLTDENNDLDLLKKARVSVRSLGDCTLRNFIRNMTKII